MCDPALDVAAVGDVHEREHAVEEHVAHMDDLPSFQKTTVSPSV